MSPAVLLQVLAPEDPLFSLLVLVMTVVGFVVVLLVIIVRLFNRPL